MGDFSTDRFVVQYGFGYLGRPNRKYFDSMEAAIQFTSSYQRRYGSILGIDKAKIRRPRVKKASKNTPAVYHRQ